MNRPVFGYILAGCALMMLVLVFGQLWSPLSHTTFGVTIGTKSNHAVVRSIASDTWAYKAGVRPGDVIDITAMPFGERVRFETWGSPLGTRITVPIVRDGVVRPFTLVSHPRPPGDPSLATWWPQLLDGLVSLLIVAVIAWRKPSTATAALVLFGMGACQTEAVAIQFSWLPDPWFTIVAVFILATFGLLPIAALLPFIVRFPHEPTTQEGRVRMRIADAFFFAMAAFCFLEIFYEPVIYGTWFTFIVAISIAILAVVLLFTVLAYRDAQGEARRRIAWVIAGLVLSAVGYTMADIVEIMPLAGYGNAYDFLNLPAELLQAALPLSLGYAVLRHRVLDLGFALNRTVVYTVITALVIAVVSFVDWLSGRLISEQRWALAVEALITIGFGFALNWIHGKTERLIDRIIFRARHLAEKRVEYRIGALGFAASASAVDDAIATEAPRILDLASAAVFGRLAENEPFARKASFGWSEETTTSIMEDSLLVRTLRSLERPVILDDVAIGLDGAPSGNARPVLAIPIVTQHELIGFALFGNRADGALPDPEEIGLLGKICSAAGNAYGAVEARQWRERAAALERSLAGASMAIGGSV